MCLVKWRGKAQGQERCMNLGRVHATTLVVSAYLPCVWLAFSVRPNQHLSYETLILLFEIFAKAVPACNTEAHLALHSCTKKEQSEGETKELCEDDRNGRYDKLL